MRGKDGTELIPLQPVIKERIWGGSRLKTEWGYACEPDTGLGECWAVSCNAQADSIVAEGRYGGKHLSQLWKEEPQLFGRETDGEDFPLLVKIIDAKEDLSIQVHPDDGYAGKHEHCRGKRECWYILDCPENAGLIVGNRAGDTGELRSMIENRQWDKLLNRIPIKRGDFIQIDPGTLHAITAGVELLEVQQNSDVTYRIYDYDRLQDGRPRQLHLQQGLEVIRVPDRTGEGDIVHTEDAGNVLQELVATCDYRVWTIRVSGVASIGQVTDSFLLGSVVAGSGRCNGERLEKGMHFIVPHGYVLSRLEGEMRIILTTPGMYRP